MSRSKPSWGFRPGEVVDGYRIEKCLGGGTSYEAYTASVLFRCVPPIRRQNEREAVVVKFVRPDRVEDEGSMRRLRREAELLERLDHSNIPRLVDVAPDGRHPRLVLERVRGTSLKECLRDGALPLPDVIALGAALAGALAHLVDNDVVHLDVKPSNVILGPRPAVIDFSVARDIASAAVLTKPVGTDIWMSPQQCLAGRGGAIDAAADVWGLGATLWRGVAGKPPFKRLKGYHRRDPLQRFPQLTSAPRALPAYVPAAFGTLLARCLRTDASSRPSAAELAEVLGSLQPAAA